MTKHESIAVADVLDGVNPTAQRPDVIIKPAVYVETVCKSDGTFSFSLLTRANGHETTFEFGRLLLVQKFETVRLEDDHVTIVGHIVGHLFCFKGERLLG